jgi:hypothetical protein
MAQTQVALRNNLTNPYNNTITTEAYAVAPNGFNSNIVSVGVNGSSGVLNSSTATQVPGAPPTYGLVYVNSVYAYGTEGNTLYQYTITNTAPGLTYSGVSWDMTNPTYAGTGFPLVNGTNVIPTNTNNYNEFSEPLQINSGGTSLDASGTTEFTVTSIFGTTSFLTSGAGNIYALLPDSRIAKITIVSNAPTSIALVTTLPVLASLTTNNSFGLAWLPGSPDYLYTYDGSSNFLTYVNASTGSFGQVVGTGLTGQGQYSGLLPANPPGGTVSSYINLDTGIEYLFIVKREAASFYRIDIAQMATETTVAYYLTNTYSFQEKPISSAILGNVLYLLSSNTPISTTYYNTYQLAISFSITPICFLKGTYIYTKEGYKQIENLKKGDLVNTFKDNYVAIDTIIEEEMYHDASKPRNKGQLFKLDYPEYPQLLKELYITGAHSILVGKLTENQKAQILKDYGKVFATDLFDRLPAYIDEKAKVHEESGTYTIYHLALENENMYSNYGIFANGLLVESLSKNDCVNRTY